MKKLLAIICSFLIAQAILAQTPTDFYFKKSLPDQCKTLTKIPTSFQGSWQSRKDTMRTIIVKENKIYSQYKHVMYLPEKELKKSGYELKDGFLYGFSEYDSLPALVKNDTVLFCYISDHEIINFDLPGENLFLSELKNGLLLSRKADSLFSYTYISIQKGELVLMEVDHEPYINEIISLCQPEELENSDGETVAYLADLNKKQMEKFIDSGFFNVIQRCQRITIP